MQTVTHKHQPVNPFLQSGIPLILALLLYMIYESTNAPGATWTHPGSEFNLTFTDWPLLNVLSRWLDHLSGFLSSGHPDRAYQSLMAGMASCTGTGVYYLIRSWFNENHNTLRSHIIPAALSLVFAASPAFWALAAQGQITLLPLGMVVLSLILINRYFIGNKSVFNMWTGMIFLGLSGMACPALFLLLPLPLIFAFSSYLRKRFPFRSFLRLLAGMWVAFCFGILLSVIIIKINLSEPELNTLFSPLTNRTESDYMTGPMGFRHLGIEFRQNTGLFAPLFMLAFLIITIRYKKNTELWPCILTLFFYLYSLGLLWPLYAETVMFDSLYIFIIPALLLLLPLYAFVLRILFKPLPGSVSWLVAVPVILLFISGWSEQTLAKDSSYILYRQILSVSPDIPSHPNTPLWNSSRILHPVPEDTLCLSLFHRFSEKLTPKALSGQPLNVHSGIHLAAVWSSMGELLIRYQKVITAPEPSPLTGTYALQAFIYAHHFDNGSIAASHYTERLSDLCLDRQDYVHMLEFTRRTLRLNPNHYNANQRFLQIHKHMGDERKALYNLRRMMKTKPENPDLQMELVRLYLNFDLPRHASINYRAALKSGLQPEADIEAKLSADRTSWVPRNIVIVPR